MKQIVLADVVRGTRRANVEDWHEKLQITDAKGTQGIVMSTL